jgi:hypothetical protein
MAGQIKIPPTTMDEAALRLARLFEELDSHKMYDSLMTGSSGAMRDKVGLLTDELYRMRTSMCRLIDGTRIALSDASAKFRAADAKAKAVVLAAAVLEKASQTRGGSL